MATATATAPGPRLRARRWFAGFASRETWAAFAFLSPWLFGFLVFTAGPMIASLILSFTDYSVIQTTHNVGWDNYHKLVHDPKVTTAMKTTLIYTAMVVPAHVIFSLGLAMVLARVGRAAGFFRTAFYLPVMTPAVAVGVLYLLLFNGDYGLVNAGLHFIGIHGPYWTTDPNWVKPSLVIMHLWKVGASVVILLAALMAVPTYLYEASAMDGASKWRRFRDVTLPMISPAIFFIVIINTIAALQTFDGDFVSHAQLVARMEEMRGVLHELNARVIHREGAIGEVFDRAWRMLEMRRMLVRVGTGYAILPGNRPLVSYYANSITHLLGPFSEGIRERDAIPALAVELDGLTSRR